MAQPVQQVKIQAPGFEGINTELSPINGDPEFALVADNLVVDQIGRLVSREAFADYVNGWSEYWELLFRWNDVDDPVNNADLTGSYHYPNDGTYFINPIDPSTPVDDGTGAVDGDGYRKVIFDPEVNAPNWESNARATLRFKDIKSYPAYVAPPPLVDPTDTYVYKISFARLSVAIPSGIPEGEVVGYIRVLADDPTDAGSSQQVVLLPLTSDGTSQIRMVSFSFFVNENTKWDITLDPRNDFKDYCNGLGLTPSMIMELDNARGNFTVDYRIYDDADGYQENQELVRLGVQKASFSSNPWNMPSDKAVAIYRYGSQLEEGPQRSIPSGFRSRSIGRALELKQPTYDLAIQSGSYLYDINLPKDFGGSWRHSYLSDAVFVNFKDKLFLFCYEEPFVEILEKGVATVEGGINYGLDPVATSTQKVDGDVAISAYGRLWVTGVNNDYNTIYYSSLLDETSWYDERVPPATPEEEATYVPPYNVQNDAGVIDVREYWPIETDRIVGIHAHNGFLLVFGRNSILVYANADRDPAGADGIQLQDTISNVGLVHKYAICNIGTDVLFVDDSGVRSLGRVIQEKSTPIAEPSLNIRREIRQLIAEELALNSEQAKINFRFFPNKSLAVLLFRSKRIAYVFHLNGLSKTGGMKITRWTNCTWNDAVELVNGYDDLMVLAGTPNKGLLKYEGYLEGDLEGEPEYYITRYESMALSLSGSPMQITIPKSIHYVCMGEHVPGQANALWGFDDKLTRSREFRVDVDDGSRYAINQFTFDENSITPLSGQYKADGGVLYKGYKINIDGSGNLFRMGFEVKVQGGKYGLQEIDINSAVGRLTA